MLTGNLYLMLTVFNIADGQSGTSVALASSCGARDINAIDIIKTTYQHILAIKKCAQYPKNISKLTPTYEYFPHPEYYIFCIYLIFLYIMGYASSSSSATTMTVYDCEHQSHVFISISTFMFYCIP